jgi:hypothetical protein
VNKFDGGLNLFISDVHLKKNESPDALNVEPDEDGIIRTRYGFSKFGTTSGLSRTRGLGWLKKDDGTRKVVLAGGTKLKVYDGAEWDDVTGVTYTADKQTDFCQARDKLFIQNGTDALSSFDGTNTATQTNGQKGTASIFFNGSLMTWGDPTAPSRLYISGTAANVGDFSAGNGGQFVDISSADGTGIVGCSKKGRLDSNILLISKERATYKLYFDGSGLPVVTTVNPNKGAVNHKVIDNFGDSIFALSQQREVLSIGEKEGYFDQIRMDELSLFISPELDTIADARLRQSTAISYRHRYYLAYSESGQTYNNKVLFYDEKYRSWWKWDGMSVNSFLVYEDTGGKEHFLFGSDKDGQVYEFDFSRDDDGVAINAYYTTPARSFDKFNITKLFYYIDFLFRNVSGGLGITVTLDEQVINKTTSIGITGTLAGFGATLFGMAMFGQDSVGSIVSDATLTTPKRLKLQKKARTFKFKIFSNDINSYWSLLDYAVSFKEKSDRRFDSKDIIR